MGTHVFRRMQLVFFALLLGALGGVPGAHLPAPLAAALAPQAAQAAVTTGGNFGSAAPCVTAPDALATTRFSDTLVSDTDPSTGQRITRVSMSETALMQFTSSGSSAAATIGQLGSVYGLAYDDGLVSGTRQMFIGAFARRMTAFGPGGPGAIYRLNLATNAVAVAAQVPGTTDRHTGDSLDTGVAPFVGRSSLGDMEISPDGTSLYVMNLDTRSIFVYSLANMAAAPQQIALNLNVISTDPAVQADLRPFGMDFRPTTNGLPGSLTIGWVDSAARNPNTIAPTAYVTYRTTAGAQGLAITQPLNAPEIQNRFGDGVNAGTRAWGGWTPIGDSSLDPMPIVSDIQFSRDSQTMMVAFRDRNGDVYVDPNHDPRWWRVQAQGDVLTYKVSGNGWALQTRAAPVTSDYFVDNYLGAGTTTTTAHVENFMGALTTTLAGAGNNPTEQVVGTAITPFSGGTSGANWYNLSNPYGPNRVAAVELNAEAGLWKSATLGDLENLCTAAYVGDRVWTDANGNGLQDAGEPGIGGVLLNLLDGNNQIVAQATTDASGLYQFAVKPGTAYTIELARSNFAAGQTLYAKIVAPKNAGSNDTIDSDADQLSRTIPIPAQMRDGTNMTFDIGIMDPVRANGIVGNFVWNDLNSNGVQDGGEPGVGGITVYLTEASNGVVYKTTTTAAADGSYQFGQVIPGTYQVAFVPPAGINASPRDAGGDDTRDSDADASTNWRTPSFTVIADTVNYTLDLGLIMGANVRITKTGPASAPVGSQVRYTLTYANDGPAQADNVVVRDTFPAGLTYVSSFPAANGLTGSTLNWNLGSLTPGQQGSITVAFAVDPAAPASGTNQAQITTTTTNDQPGDNTSTVITQFTRPNVVATKTGPATATVGDQLTYSLSYANTGSAAAASVSLVDTLPAGLSFVSANPAPASVSGQTVTWSLGTLNAGQQGTISLVVQSSSSLANGTVLTNNATISTPTSGDTPGDNTTTTSVTLQRADVRVTKSSTTNFPVTSGQSVTYAIDYANAGPAAALGVVLTDNVPAELTGVTWSCASGCTGSGSGNAITLNLGTLAAGATGRIVVTGTAQTSTSRTDFTNTATISTTTPESDTTNNQSSVPGAVWTSDVQVIKLATPQVVAGTTLTATLSYRNNGPAAAAATTLVDTLPAGITFVSAVPAPASVSGQTITWNLGTLADAQNGMISLVLKSDAGIADGTTVVNQSRISTTTADRDSTNDQSSAPTLIVTSSDVAAVKIAPPRITAGGSVTYNLSYRNNGPSVARGVVLTDRLPAELDYTSGTPAPSSVAAGLLTWNLGDLQPNQSGIITVMMQSRSGQTVATLVATNTLQISSPTTDPAPGNNTSTVTTNIETADVSIIKRSPTFIVAGAPFTVTLDYQNAGPATATNVLVRDLLPSGLTVVSASPAATGPGLRWTIGTLAAGATGRITVVLAAPTSAISGTTYTNVALIDSPVVPDRDTSNDTSSTVSTVRPNADLVMVKTGPAVPVRSGSDATYTLTYRNNGPSQALNVAVTDTFPTGFVFKSATPAPTTLTATSATWSIGTLDVGTSGTITVVGTLIGSGTTTTVSNQASVASPSTPDPTPGNNISTFPVTVQNPDLAVTKTDGVIQAQPGDTLTYTIQATNNGAATATGVTLREVPPVGVLVLSMDWMAQGDGSYVFTVGTRAPGASTTATFRVKLPNPLPAGLLAGVTNTVQVTDDGTTGSDPTPSNNTATDLDTVATASLGDTIWNDTNGNGAQDAGEVGFGGLQIDLLDSATGNVLASTQADANGHYLFDGLRYGDYAVVIASTSLRTSGMSDYRYTTPAQPTTTLTAATPTDMRLDIGLRPVGVTAVVFAFVRAERAGETGDVTVRWRSIIETNTLRYRVLRAYADAETPTEIAVVTATGGGDYQVIDQAASSRARYWVEEIERGGRVTRYGPFAQQVPTTTTVLQPTPTNQTGYQVFLPFAVR